MTIINQVTSFKISGFSYNGTDTQLNYTAGVTTGIAQPSKALVLDANRDITSGINVLTMTGLVTTNLTVNGISFNNNILNNLSTLDGVSAGIATENKVLIVNSSRNLSNINILNANTINTTIGTASQPNITGLGTLTSLTSNGNVNIAQHNGTTTGLMLNSILVTASANEINRLTGITSSTNELNRLTGLTSSTNELNRLTGLLSTTNELNILSGVTANANQLNFLSGVSAGTVSASRAMVVDVSRNITNMGSLTSTGSITLSTGRLWMANTNFGISHRNTNGSSEIVTFSDGNNLNYIGSHTNHDFSLSVNQIQYLTVKNTTGRIGINTSSPNMQLEVNSHSGNCLRLFNSGGNTFLDITVNNQGLTTLSLSGSSPSFTLSHSVNIIDSTSSTSTTTGALVVTGGAGIGGALNVGGTITAIGNITGTLATASQPNITSVGTLTGLTSSGIINVTNNTTSSSTTTGALIVSGGVGINNNINVARNISYGLTNFNWTGTSWAGIHMNNNASMVTNTSVAQNGTISLLTTNHINRITLTASNTNVTTTLASSLYIDNAPLAGTNMNITNSYALVINAGRTLINDGTVSNSTSSGALIINGGLGMGGSLNVGGTITATGNITGTLATASQPNITSLGILTGLSTASLTINGTLVTSTATELNYLDLPVGPGTASENRAVVVDNSRNIININNLTASNLTGTLQTSAQPNITSTGNLTIPGGITITSGETPLNLSNTVSSSNFRLTIQGSGGHQDLGSFSAHDMSLRTNNIRRLTISSNGNVNITGHNNTNTGLQLNGTLVTSSATELNYLDLSTGPGTGEANKALVLDDSRNIVNINSISLTGNNDVITLTNTVSSNRTSIRFINNARSWELGSRGSTATDPNSFYLWDNVAGSMRLNINSAGNVGIGTTSQSYRLDVSGDINSSGLLRTTANGTGFLHTQNGISLSSWVSSTNSNAWFGTSSNHDLIFQRSGAERLRIQSNGTNIVGGLNVNDYIQIGTSTDTARMISALDSTMTTGTTRFITLGQSNTSGNQAEISFIYQGNNSNDNALGLGFHGGLRARLTRWGSFSLNTNDTTFGIYRARFVISSPAADEWGAVFRNTSNSNNRFIIFYDLNGNEKGGITFGTGTTSFNTSSDYRLKKDITPIKNGLDLVKKINPVRYKWKDSNIDAEGFIAHELQEVLPLCVMGNKDELNEDGSIKAQSIDYGKLTPVLVSAVQNLKDEKDILETEIENLKNENKLLKEQIEIIKNKLKI